MRAIYRIHFHVFTFEYTYGVLGRNHPAVSCTGCVSLKLALFHARLEIYMCSITISVDSAANSKMAFFARFSNAYFIL